uniref:Uncharacterized protein n=1 Tax=viral metagenome TaxID=1070528 RepID=A0A6C0BKH3_9ZZZZ
MDSLEQRRLIREISNAEYKYNTSMQVALNDSLNNLTHEQRIVFLSFLTYLTDWASIPQDEYMNGSDNIINVPIGLSGFDDLGVTPLARLRLSELSEILDFHIILCTNGKRQLALRVNDHSNIVRTSLLHLYELYKVGSYLTTYINIQSGRVCNDDNIVSLGCKTEQDLEGINRLPIHVLRDMHEQVILRSNLMRSLEGDGDVDRFCLRSNIL